MVLHHHHRHQLTLPYLYPSLYLRLIIDLGCWLRAFLLISNQSDLVDVLLTDGFDSLNHTSIIHVYAAFDIDDALFRRFAFHSLLDHLTQRVDRKLFLTDIEITIVRYRDDHRSVLSD